jgi:guanylate kinase
MNQGKLIIFCAPSGSGKTTIVKHLLTKFGDKLAFSVSATTREPRISEVDGTHYYFLSKSIFEQKIVEGDFVEYEEVYQGTYYGTLKEELERLWSQGKIVLFDVDVKGGLSLKKYFGDNALAIFVKVPSLEILHQRLIARQTENSKSIEKRMQKAAYELGFENQFDTTLLNDELNTACKNSEILITNFLTHHFENDLNK